MVTLSSERFNFAASSAAISAMASTAATAFLLYSIAGEFIPEQLSSFISAKFQTISKMLSTQITVVIEEFNGLAPNQMFEASNIYLGSKISPTARRIKACKKEKEKEVVFAVDKDEEIVEFFDGVRVCWVLVSTAMAALEKSSTQGKKRRESAIGVMRSEARWFELRFHKKYKELILSSYLRHVLKEVKNIKESRKEIKLHTVDYNGTDYWSSIILDHPATFDKIAMDPEVKEGLIEDLGKFIKRRDYYRRVGKAWKRGYLLYGPPGTGKSSLVAAMANYLKFDVYDLDLKEIMCNSDLRRLLIGTSSKSILVIEDIDCSVELQNRDAQSEAQPHVDDEKVSLSGLLNFIDGLWSTCGDERIIVFTTNHKDRLDPALLRPGRMDVHIHMSYCTFSGFKVLAANYLEIKYHLLYKDIEELFDQVEVTPAEIAGELMKSDNPQLALQGLLRFLKDSRKRSNSFESNDP